MNKGCQNWTWLLFGLYGRSGRSFPTVSLIQFRMEGSETLVRTRGVLEAQALCTPKLTTPARSQDPLSRVLFLINSETGPPESPWHPLDPDPGFQTHIWCFSRLATRPTSFLHSSRCVSFSPLNSCRTLADFPAPKPFTTLPQPFRTRNVDVFSFSECGDGRQTGWMVVVNWTGLSKTSTATSN